MTVAAGFRTMNGVLIWADTEYSGTASKSHAKKILPAMGESSQEASAIFSFAGNSELAIAALQNTLRTLPIQHWSGSF
jgi:hypothetical protein